LFYFFKDALAFFFRVVVGPVLRRMPILQIMCAICCRLASSCIHNLAFYVIKEIKATFPNWKCSW